MCLVGMEVLSADRHVVSSGRRGEKVLLKVVLTDRSSCLTTICWWDGLFLCVAQQLSMCVRGHGHSCIRVFVFFPVVVCDFWEQMCSWSRARDSSLFLPHVASLCKLCFCHQLPSFSFSRHLLPSWFVFLSFTSYIPYSMFPNYLLSFSFVHPQFLDNLLLHYVLFLLPSLLPYILLRLISFHFGVCCCSPYLASCVLVMLHFSSATTQQ